MKYVYGKRMKTLRDRLTTGVAAIALLANSVGMSLPFILTQRAAAATTVVSPINMGSWTPHTTASGTVEFVPIAGTLGVGAAKLTTINDNDSRARLSTDQFSGTRLDAVKEASYSSFVESASNAVGSVSYSLMIDVDGNLATTTDRVSLNHEPYWQNGLGDPAPVVHSTWQQWDVADGKFWARNATLGFMSEAGGPPLYSLADILGIAPDAVVTDVSVYIGSYNPAYTTYVDEVSFNGVVADFEPATVAPCTTTSNLHSLSLAAWDLSETRVTGHNEVTADGLHVWTEGATSTDKAAGYYTTDFALADVGVPSIEFVSYTGGRPSLQLGVDKDANGSWDGYLVYEPWAYTEGYYWSNGNFGISSGMGYTSYGTLNDYLNANPNARVTSIGYSLGSGVLGDAVISKITAGCVEYTFGLDTEAPLVTINSPINDTAVNGVIDVLGTVTDNETLSHYTIYLYPGSTNLGGGDVPAGWISVPGWQQTNTSADHVDVVRTLDTTGLAEGEYQIRLAARDAAGNRDTSDVYNGGRSSVHVIRFTVDRTVPTAPTITAPGARTWHRTAPIVNSWTAATDDNGIAYYQIAYNYDDGHVFGGVNGCPGVVIPGASGFIGCRDVNGLTRNHQPTVDEQGGVTIWVRAVDNAGNAGPWSPSVHYYYDHEAPVTDIQVSTPVNGTFTVSGDASDNLRLNRVYVQLVNRVTGLRCGGTTISFVADNTDTASWSVDYDLATLGANCPEGNFAAHVEVVDMAGNRGTAGWTDNFLVEAAAVAAVLACKVDQAGINLSGWQLALLGEKVDELSVNSRTNDSGNQVVSGTLPAGDYVVKVSGTFRYRGGTNLIADARFSERLPSDPTYGGPYSPWATGSTGWLHMNGDNTVWGTTYSSDHTYYATLSLAADGTVSFYIGDNQYTDNNGSLTVEILAGYTGITGDDGCVAFDGVPYGAYTIEELLQPDWENISGLGEVEVDEPEVTFTVVNRDTTAEEVEENPTAPQTLSWVEDGDEGQTLSCGDTTSSSRIAPTWTAVDGAEYYIYQFKRPGSSVWENGGTYTDPTTGPTAFGSDAGDAGVWEYRVKAVFEGGIESDWSESCPITFEPQDDGGDNGDNGGDDDGQGGDDDDDGDNGDDDGQDDGGSVDPDDNDVQSAVDCDGDGITDPNGCENGNGSRASTAGTNDILNRAQGGQVLAATTGLAGTGTQNGGILALLATSIMAIALLTIRRKQES